MSRPRSSKASTTPVSSSGRRELIVIDDEPLILATTTMLLDTEGWYARPFSDPLDALIYASDAEPTCIVVDLKLPGIEGLDLVAAFRALELHAVILVSAYIDVPQTVEAMRTGVDDVLLKPVKADRLFNAVATSLAALDKLQRQDTLTFTRRERQVAEFIIRGRSTKEIAKALDISPRTVEFFRTSLLRKTQSSNTASLVTSLMQLGFHPLSPSSS